MNNDIVIDDVELKEEERQRCEVWTRVMGYYRPTSFFNVGKQGEHEERVHFDEKVSCVDADMRYADMKDYKDCAC
ncbi:MAG: hypothetical protein E7015_01215 [Alphaproteobacteria bacterium]|nr:hypothetical protein [Alphaproteobacteria bacterium]